MKIAILSKSDRLGGGGGRCAEDLVNLLKENNHYVDHFVRSSKYTDAIELYTEKEKWLYHRLRSLGFQEIIPFEKKVINEYDSKKKYDIFHFHDISSAISPLTIKYLSDKNKCIVWTLHDCTMVTGGCVNPLGCIKYKSICFNCPQLGQFPLAKNIDLSFLFHSIKKYVLKNSNIHFVTPSKWLANFVYNSGLTKEYPTIISNGVDVKLFKVYNKQLIRKELNLPNDRFIILLSSSSFNNIYKGLEYSLSVLKSIFDINPFILMVGNTDDEVKKKFQVFDKFETGYIEEKTQLNKYYASADIFLNTTIAEVQSITSLESMASGTPVFGFATGGVPEFISQNIDGFLVEDKDIYKLAKEIRYIFNKHTYLHEMQQNARKKIEENYSLDIFLKNYLNLYETIIQK
jgi:glycosyltransferase involved in cell wall biosynthesis